MSIQPIPNPPPPPDGTQGDYMKRILYNPTLTSEQKEILLKNWVPEE